jgi:type I restriction enzyme, S subunit
MEALLRHFHEVITTEADVEQLKKLILRLAFEGRLVPQNLNKESVSVLLKRIKEEKNRLFGEKKIKKQKQLPPIDDDEQPYKLPDNWTWIRLRDVGYNHGQKKPDKTFCYIDVASIDNYNGVISTDIQVLNPDEAPSRARKLVKMGTVIYSTVRPYLLNIAIVDREFEHEPIVSTAFAILQPYEGIESEYVYYYLKSPAFIEYVESKMIGVAYPAINDLQFFSGLLPLAPNEEQLRIVQEIKKLMEICDQLKEAIGIKEQASSVMNRSVFTKIQDNTNPAQLEDLQFVIGNIEHLCNTKEDIELLRNSILSLAMQGRLVEQNPSNESATLLLQKVREEKVRLVAEKKVRKEKELEPITPTEIPYELPNGWTWSRIGEVYTTVSGSTPSRAVTSYFKGGTIHWVKTKDLNNGVVQACEENITEKAVQDAKLKILPPQTVCIAMYGGAGTIGKSGIFNFYSTINQSICALLPNQFMNPYYLHYYILSVRKEWMRFASSTRKDPNINRDIIKMFLIPVPPLEEQKCIAEKVGRLMTLCDELVKNIEQSQLKSEKSLKAVLQETVTVKEEVLK